MKIRWLGHASFLIESAGEVLLTDPFDEKIGYATYGGNAHIVTVSHEHWDHNAVKNLAGQPRVIRESAGFKDEVFDIEGIDSFHDKEQGKKRGRNTVFKITAEDIKIVHLGDLGQIPTPEQADKIGEVDILLIPVGGCYTLDADDAVLVVEQLKPAIVIPMHFLTPAVSLRELAPAEAFTARFTRVVKKPYLEIDRSQLPAETRVMILDYAIN